MIKVLKEEPTEVKEKYYTAEELKKQPYLCMYSGGEKYLVATQSINKSDHINNTYSDVCILDCDSIYESFKYGTQDRFIVFKTRREMFLWLAED